MSLTYIPLTHSMRNLLRVCNLLLVRAFRLRYEYSRSIVESKKEKAVAARQNLT